LTISAFPEAPAPLVEELAPAFFSKIFQNLRLSSAARKKILARATDRQIK
jgi:hypothetical protein